MEASAGYGSAPADSGCGPRFAPRSVSRSRTVSARTARNASAGVGTAAGSGSEAGRRETRRR